MEHLPSDSKNIKESLTHLAKYIENKKINWDKSNNIKDFESIGEAIWRFISAIYKSGWDSLFADNYKNLFRWKVSFHCTPKTNPIKNGKKGDKETNKLASIERLPPPILAKSPKEVNEISKYFKMQKPSPTNTNLRKSYAQASKSISNIEKVLKIKEIFLSLKANKINNIQKIKGNGKPKPHINMTMKGPSRKQVIISMNNDNKKNFMEESNSHVTNMNSVLKNIKSEVMVDFVWVDPKDIIIMTNKVALILDL